MVDEDTVKRRKRKGGSKRKFYVDGWVEFQNKKDARRVARELNSTQIGGKKNNPFYYDLWNIKYLRGFKWYNLTEEIRERNRTREKKLKQRVKQAKEDANQFIEGIEADYVDQKIKERKNKKKRKRNE